MRFRPLFRIEPTTSSRPAVDHRQSKPHDFDLHSQLRPQLTTSLMSNRQFPCSLPML